jgi:hypothetical protein
VVDGVRPPANWPERRGVTGRVLTIGSLLPVLSGIEAKVQSRRGVFRVGTICALVSVCLPAAEPAESERTRRNDDHVESATEGDSGA